MVVLGGGGFIYFWCEVVAVRVCVDVRGSYVHKRKGRLVVRSPAPIMVTEYKQATFGFFEAEEGVVDRRYRWQKVTRRAVSYTHLTLPTKA